ncbi:hypothetical protein AJ78_00671 [Emergomyces pasteurianus Ep9510]|uniref:Uncharacterized protein n=1 Tax=Emergomyces pasteurianus Ep9510 TaxID=1447872 RepID=A0A1J9PSK3_9EURO|nr:hypothetical protein AJ78_00671 [Emergomyces pasteurianus Ep9510]
MVNRLTTWKTMKSQSMSSCDTRNPSSHHSVTSMLPQSLVTWQQTSQNPKVNFNGPRKATDQKVKVDLFSPAIPVNTEHNELAFSGPASDAEWIHPPPLPSARQVGSARNEDDGLFWNMENIGASSLRCGMHRSLNP